MRIIKKRFLAAAIILALLASLYGSTGIWAEAAEEKAQEQAGQTEILPSVFAAEDGTGAAVYMTTDISPEGLGKVYDALNWVPSGNVAVKLSTGEPPNSNYLRPELIRDLVERVNGTIVECNTAYGGSRAETNMHYQVAADHGFTDMGKGFVIMDENRESMIIPVTGGRRLTENYVGAHFGDFDSFLVLSHFKGHAMAGFGGAIKNISIGIGSAEGKCLIHTAGQSHTSPWGGNQDAFLESMADAGKSVSDYLNGNIVYVNVMNRLSIDCDCDGNPSAPDIHDIGILASTDPVALDQACVDLIKQADGNASFLRRMQGQNAEHVLESGEAIGLGSRSYHLVDVENAGEHEHTYGAWETVKSPTCADAGSRQRICSVCGYIETSGLDATGHDWETDDTIDQAPTCTAGGSRSIHCKNCDAVKDSETIPALGHSFKEEVVPATAKANGSILTKCSRCETVTNEDVIYAANSIKLSKTSYTYNGKTRKPSVTVKDSRGSDLKQGTDYTVTYPKGMKNVGAYSVTVKFGDHYSGTEKQTFTINPRSTSISKLTPQKKGFTVKWKKQGKEVGGYQIAYSTSSKFVKSQTTLKKIKGSKTTAKKYTKLKPGKKYYVRIRTYKTVGKKTYYSGWSGKKSVKTKK